MAEQRSRDSGGKMKRVIRVTLIEFDGKPAVEFQGGDILFQTDSISEFLRQLATMTGWQGASITVILQETG